MFSGAPYHGFSVIIVMCQLFKSVLQHVHFPKPDDSPEDLSNGPFWKRHRDLDNKLSNLFMFLPERLRLPQNTRDPMAIQVKLNVHACVICLHHAALEVIEKCKHPKYLEETSLSRLRTSAEEITSVVRLVGSNSYYFVSCARRRLLTMSDLLTLSTERAPQLFVSLLCHHGLCLLGQGQRGIGADCD